MFKKTIAMLVLLAVMLVAVGLVGIYQENGEQPDGPLWLVAVQGKDEANLKVNVHAYGNYDLLAVIETNEGYLLVLRNRPWWIEMWQ